MTGHLLPLSGRRIVITRAHHQAAPLAGALEALGAAVISIPTIEIRPPQSFQPLDKALAFVQKYDWLILTSVNGVHALKRRMDKAAMPVSALRHLSVAAIGPATAAELAELGAKVDCIPEKYVAESVVQALKGKVSGKRVLLVRAKVARDLIPRELREAGAEVDVVEAYETVVPANSRQKLQEHIVEGRLDADCVTFTSSSTVRNFTAVLPAGVSPKALLEGVVIASVGPVTSETLKDLGLRPAIQAEDYSIPGLVQAITAHFSARDQQSPQA